MYLTQEKRETIQRALGILEGVSYAIESDAVKSIYLTALEMLDETIKEENGEPRL